MSPLSFLTDLGQFLIQVWGFLGKIYLVFDEKTKARFSLIGNMRGIDPMIIPLSKRESYLVRGTLISILREGDKYSIYLGEVVPTFSKLTNEDGVFHSYRFLHGMWKKKVSLMEIMEICPSKVSSKFLFNLDLF